MIFYNIADGRWYQPSMTPNDVFVMVPVRAPIQAKINGIWHYYSEDEEHWIMSEKINGLREKDIRDIAISSSPLGLPIYNGPVIPIIYRRPRVRDYQLEWL